MYELGIGFGLLQDRQCLQCSRSPQGQQDSKAPQALQGPRVPARPTISARPGPQRWCDGSAWSLPNQGLSDVTARARAVGADTKRTDVIPGVLICASCMSMARLHNAQLVTRVKLCHTRYLV